MLKSKNNKKTGFTLIELLVVIAIIGILAAIVLVGVNDVRRKSRNIKRLADIRNYASAFAMAYDQNGEYPDPGNTFPYCLGDYPDDTCSSEEVSESPDLNAILDDFIALPTDEYPILCDGWDASGYIYNCSNRPSSTGICRRVTVYWTMEGAYQSCGVGTIRLGFEDYCGNTFCIYTSPLLQ